MVVMVVCVVSLVGGFMAWKKDFDGLFVAWIRSETDTIQAGLCNAKTALSLLDICRVIGLTRSMRFEI